MKKIAIIGTVGLPASYGGFETLAENITAHLNKDYAFTVYCSGVRYSDKKEKHNNARLVYLPFDANGSQSIIYDIISIISALFYADVLLVLGVSGCLLLPFIRLFTKLTGKKIVVNIDGLEWQRDKFGSFAKWFLKLSEKAAVIFSDAVICDNKAILDYVQQTYSKTGYLIEYGGDNACQVSYNARDLEKYPFLKKNYAFSVCRIEPENNLHLLLEAFSCQQQIPLVIVGNWQSSRYGMELWERYHNNDSIILLDPVYQREAVNMLRSNCSLYLHGHSAGGTNPSLVEAMSSGLPIAAYDVIYNRETTENQALYFKTATELTTLIGKLEETTLSDLRKRMANVAERRYRWQVIVDKYRHFFN